MPCPPDRAAAAPFCDKLPSRCAPLLTSSSISSVRLPFLEYPLLLTALESISNASTEEVLGEALARPDLDVTSGDVGVSSA